MRSTQRQESWEGRYQTLVNAHLSPTEALKYFSTSKIKLLGTDYHQVTQSKSVITVPVSTVKNPTASIQ